MVLFRKIHSRTNKGKTPLDLAPDNSEIKDLLLNPPERIVLTPEKSHNETNGSLNESGEYRINSEKRCLG